MFDGLTFIKHLPVASSFLLIKTTLVSLTKTYSRHELLELVLNRTRKLSGKVFRGCLNYPRYYAHYSNSRIPKWEIPYATLRIFSDVVIRLASVVCVSDCVCIREHQ